MIMTTIGPIHPRQPLDGMAGTSRAGSDATSRRGAGVRAALTAVVAGSVAVTGTS
jgi:hypothetical protein